MNKRHKMAAWMLACLAGAGAAPASAQTGAGDDALALHVPSPDWRDQIVYFVMIDRFADGDPGNNDQGAGEYDPADNTKYSGGDLAGVAARLDYIQGLGATSVWITPPVANRWWDPQARYGGYHGYWAQDFKAVDAHYGTLQDYRRLSHLLHRRGMYLIQDVVVNHTGNFFTYGDGWDPRDPARNVRRIADASGVVAPTRAPFDQNDATDPAHRAAGIYHWTPAITDYADPVQEQTFQLADLDDLDTGNPVVRRALRDAYGHWIREVGVDGFRVDTAFYVEPDYFADFMHADDPDAPGMAGAAQSTGRDDFHVFGEGFGIDKPFDDAQMRRIDTYMRTADGAPLMPGMIQFPLYGTLGDVFARGRPTAELAYRIRATLERHAHPHLMPSFVDNHDVDRFLAGGSEAALKQALLLIMTLPGIPTVYYGTEQGFTTQRAAMFAGGYGSGGYDRFDTEAPLYRFIRDAPALRRGHRLFSRGTPTVLQDDAAGPGVLAYRMDGEGESALVVFNTADHEVLMDNLATGLDAGRVLEGVFALQGEAPDIVVGADGRVHRLLPARSGFVWKSGARRQAVPSVAVLSVDAGDARHAGDFEVSGRGPADVQLALVVDGDTTRAQTVRTGAEGRWSARVDTRDMVAEDVTHRWVAWHRESGAVSAPQAFSVAREWTPRVDMADPAGDDHGRDGRYRYPTDPAWTAHRPQDILGLRAWSAGGALKLELRMRSLLALWNPANGFDHVAFTVFLGLPDTPGGSTIMPLQNGTLPAGMRWHYRLRTHGWSNALFSADGADADREGTPVSPGATLQADTARNTLTLTFPAGALGYRASLSGLKVYVNTWDYDGHYRGLTPLPAAFGFGGSDGARDPLVMDETAVVTLP